MKAKPYLMITRNSIMACLAYRGHFYFSLAGTAVYLVVSWFLWKAVYASGGTIGGLTFTQAYLYVGISMSLVGLMQTAAGWQLNSMVRNGDLVRFLTKPIGFQLQLFADSLGNGIVNGVMIAVPSLVIVYVLSGAGAPPLERALLFIPSIAIGFLLNFFFDFLVGLSVFVTHSIGGISNTKETIVLFLSGAIVPLPFFPAGIRRVLEWLPFQALYNAPARLLVDGSLGSTEILMYFLKQAAWFLLFCLLVRLLFSAAVKRVVVNGG